MGYRCRMPTQDADFTVFDRDREIRFTGRRIAAASAARPGKKRWLELELFRTTGGTYLVVGAGKTEVPGERTRRFVHRCESAQGVLEQLYMYDDNDTAYLTRVARELLDEASAVDVDIERAYTVEHIP